jgi:hypothetical protein
MSCLLPPVCAFCTHLLNEPEQECRAFHEIPAVIMNGTCDHTEPYPDDGGVCFQLIPDYAEDFAEVNNIRQEMGLPLFRLAPAPFHPMPEGSPQTSTACC